MFGPTAPRRNEKLARLAVVAALLGLLAGPTLARTAQATSLVARFVGKDPGLGKREVDVTSLDVEGMPSRVYVPRGAPDAPALVLLHGVHRLGIDEPRLAHFAKVVAESGVLVVTPLVKEIADYRVERASLSSVGAGVREAKRRSGRAKVGVLGLSFAGGLAVMAATDPATRDDLAFVVSVGGHGDLGRVLRFFVENRIDGPDGPVELAAHDYGLLVLAYDHAAELFPGPDGELAERAFRTWLVGDPPAAKELAKGLSPTGRARFDLFARHDQAALRDVLLPLLDAHRDAIARVSPERRAASAAVPVFLLHGKGDDVIPHTEALRLHRALPDDARGPLLVSERLKHVELTGTPTVKDGVELVSFLAAVLEAAENEPRDRSGG